MTHRFRVLGSALVVALGTSPGIACPAHAERLAAGDATRDVRYFESSAADSISAPDHDNGDLKRYAVRYGDRRIWFLQKFRELNRSEPVLVAGGAFRFPAHGQLNYYEAVVRARAGSWSGRARISGKPKCAVSHSINFADNRIAVSFPAACFGSPRWLQFNAFAVTTDHWQDNATYAYGDRSPGTMRGERWTTRMRQG